MKRLALLLAFVASPAFAADHTFTVNDQELSVIGEALQQAPYFKAAPVVNKLQQQLQPKPPEPEKPTK